MSSAPPRRREPPPVPLAGRPPDRAPAYARLAPARASSGLEGIASGLVAVALVLAGAAFGLTTGAHPLSATQGITTAAASGRVADQDGQPVAGAQIDLRHANTGAAYATASDEEGRFNFANLRPGGPYTLTVARIGLRTVSREGLFLSIGQRLRLEIELSSAALPLPELAVRVDMDPEFDEARMGTAKLVDREALERLPTITRDFTDFAKLAPLVAVDEDGASVAGSNIRFNSIQIDGALNQDVFGLSPTGVAGGQSRGRLIPLSAIEQLQILIAPYDVRQSGFTGGVLNAVTRTGTNDFQASAFTFFRNEALAGDALIGGVAREPGDLDNLYAGFDVSGPIARDRVHFFVAGEVERRARTPDGFTVGVDEPLRTQLDADSVARLSGLLAGYGAEAGEAGLYTLNNNLANLFARIDARIDDDNSLMLRYNMALAGDDPAPNRLPGDAYELSSNGTRRNSRNHSVVGQWLATLGPSLSNDLTINAQILRDRERPNAAFPRIEVTLEGGPDGSGYRRRVRAGSNFFGQDSDLAQDVLQISNALTLSLGNNHLTVGAGLDRFAIRRDYLPGGLGSYTFNSVKDIAANAPSEYTVNLPLSDDAATTRFVVNQLSAFVQDEVSVGEALNLRLGVRMDLPLRPGPPPDNPAVRSSFGVGTNQLPGGNPLFSPRAGFNLRLGANKEVQIRGGAGLFTGRPPFAWLANAYQNSGLTSAFLTCRRRNIGVPDPEIVPAFDPKSPTPTSCADGAGASSALPVITVFDPDFRFPQDFKTSLAVDQRLPAGFVLSLEGVYTKAVNQIGLQDLNIGPVVPLGDRTPENGFTDGFGYGIRETFADAGDGSEFVDPPPGSGPGEREPIFFPRRVDEAFGQVIKVGNRTANFAYALSVRLRKRFGAWLSAEAGYAYNRSADVRSLVSLDAVANFGFTAIEGDPNNPTRQPSLFDRPHKLLATAAARLPKKLGGGELSLVYVGQSGRPYSYVYADDINGDAYPGLGQAASLANDLIFVTDGVFDFPDANRSPVSGLLFEQLVLRERCLSGSRQRILHRNACRTPWSHQLDLRIRQEVAVGGAQVAFMIDVLNFVNLFNNSWGHVQTVNPVVQLLAVENRVEDDAEPNSVLPEADDPLGARYAGALRKSDTGGVAAAVPYVPRIGASQWQAQLGIEIRFR